MTRSTYCPRLSTTRSLVLLSAALMLGCSDTPERRAAQLAPVEVPTPFIRSEHDHLNELIPNLEVVDLAGRPVRLSDLAGKSGLVIVTLDTSCPVVTRYAARIAELEAANIARGLPFVFLNTTGNAVSEMQQQVAAVGLRGRYLRDTLGVLGRALGARTSAEVFVLDARRTLVYRGAIDDQYRQDHARDDVQRPYLKAALDDLFAGRQIQLAATTAPGCDLGLDPSPIATSAPTTYQHQVSRIIQARCLSCHREGGAGPFSFATYEQVVAHKDRIPVVLKEGKMPPWFAAPGHGPWANDPSLTASERQALYSWFDGGMPKGDSADAPLQREFFDGWGIGAPDLVIELPEPEEIPAQGILPYRYITVDVDLPEAKWVQAVQVRPVATSNLHHVLVFLEPRGAGGGRAKGRANAQDGPSSPKGAIHEMQHGLESYFAGYGPGSANAVFPPGTAKRLPKKARLIFQMHFVTNGVAATERTRMGLVFSKEAPRFEVQTSSAYNNSFEIPAGHSNFPVVGSYEFKEPGQLMSFMPHMHLRGKSFRYDLVDPDGVERTILSVPRYGFQWQVSYNLAIPIPVARGSRIVATGWFDNSADNPGNPDATVPVGFGMQSTEEMMIGYFNWIPDRALAPRSKKP